MITIQDPGHFENDNVVQEVRIVISKERDQVLDKLHVQIADPGASHFEEDGNLLTLLLLLQPFKPVNQALLNLLHFELAFDVAPNFDDEHQPAVLVSGVREHPTDVDDIQIDVRMTDICIIQSN